MEKNQVTIHDIAKALDINASTVSRALNNSDKVTIKTKEKILETANALGYQRNFLASNLRKNKTNTIGVIVPRISRYFFSAAIAGIEEIAYEKGYSVIICQSLEQLEREQNITENLISNRVDGVLISISMETSDYAHLLKLKERGPEFLFFDRHCEIDGINAVLVDDFKGGFDATEHLILKGCKNIAHFSGPQALKIYQNRLEGYKAALKKHHIPFDQNLILSSRLMEKDGWENAKKIKAMSIKVDGIFASNDVSAIGAIKYFKAHKYRIPSDIAIVGFSNEPISEIIEPSLTTIEQSGFQIGKEAVKILIAQIKGFHGHSPTGPTILKPKLIERDSTRR